MNATTMRLPTYAISHGGGPWPWIMDQMPGVWNKLDASLRALPSELPQRPRAVLMVSAHWEAPEFSVQTHPKPPMLYDYGGFPEFTYSIQYPAPGAPDLAEEVAALLAQSGFPVRRDAERGFDHGVFAPAYPMYPDADMPIVQLSLRADLDPGAHLDAGRALAPLRDSDVLIVGSGFPSFHDLSNFGASAAVPSRRFDAWLTETLVDHVGSARSARLLQWEKAPAARQAHPREEHLLPVMVAVGAAEGDEGFVHYRETKLMGGITSSSYRIGVAEVAGT